MIAFVMPRRRSQTFRCIPLQDLLAQLLRAPAKRRTTHIRHLERLHDSLEPQRAYPLDFLVFQITQYRSDSDEPTLLVGEAVLPDLRMMIDALSRVTPVDRDASQTYRPQDLADRWDVSLKTIDRYRNLGLRWRWQPASQPTPRHPIELVYPAEAVERFEQQQELRLARASNHGQWDEQSLSQAIRRGLRLLNRTSATPNRIATYLSQKLDRPPETLRRRLIRAHTGSQQLTDRDEAVIARAHRMGVDVGMIAERFGRSRSSIYRIVNSRRAREAKKIRIEHATAAKPYLDKTCPDIERVTTPLPAATMTALRQLPGDLAQVFDQPMLSESCEHDLMIHMHRLRATARDLRDRLDPSRPKASDIEKIPQLLEQAELVRSEAARAQGSLLVMVTRQHLTDRDELADRKHLKMLGLAIDELDAALTDHDPWQPQRFGRYLRLRLQRMLTRASDPGPDEGRARRRSEPEVLVETIRKRWLSLARIKD